MQLSVNSNTLRVRFQAPRDLIKTIVIFVITRQLTPRWVLARFLRPGILTCCSIYRDATAPRPRRIPWVACWFLVWKEGEGRLNSPFRVEQHTLTPNLRPPSGLERQKRTRFSARCSGIAERHVKGLPIEWAVTETSSGLAESIVRHALSGSGRHSLGDQGKKGMGLTVRHVEAVRKGSRVQARGLSTHDRHPRFTLSSPTLLSLSLRVRPPPPP